jgi:alkylation response protein AidB-like acyl-CoA dehydrogenase
VSLAADLRDELSAVLDRALAAELPVPVLLQGARQDTHPTGDHHRAVASLGFFGVCVPMEAGGLGVDRGTLASLFEVAGVRLLPSAAREETVVLAPLLAAAARRGDAEARQWLAALQAGRLRGGGRAFVPGMTKTVGLSEAGDGAVTLALDGAPLWLGEGAAVAHVLTAELAALVELDAPGLSVTPVRGALDPGQGLCRVSGEVTVPAARLLRGDDAAELLLDWEVAVHAEMLGCGEHLLRTTVAYAGERRQFGQRISSFQAIAHRLAEMAVNVEAVRSALARLVSVGEADRAGAEALAASLRYWVPWAIRGVCEGAIQVHGGVGFTWEAGLHLHYRRVLQLQAALGGAVASARAVGRGELEGVSA